MGDPPWDSCVTEGSAAPSGEQDGSFAAMPPLCPRNDGSVEIAKGKDVSRRRQCCQASWCAFCSRVLGARNGQCLPSDWRQQLAHYPGRRAPEAAPEVAPPQQQSAAKQPAAKQQRKRTEPEESDDDDSDEDDLSSAAAEGEQQPRQLKLGAQ